MMLRATALALSVFCLSACPKKAVGRVDLNEAADAGVKPEPYEAVELSAPPAIPLPPAHLTDVEDSKDNPSTPEKVALGHQLFFDTRLSKDGSQSCSSCHVPERNWTTSKAVDTKVGGGINKRNAPTVVNLAYHSSWYWDGRMASIEAVSNAAWKGQLGADPETIASQLNANPTYRALFQRAFKGPATKENIPFAFAAFLRALKEGNSAFDRFEAGDTNAISADAKKGYELFKKSGCIGCHVPPIFTDFDFHNIGIGFDKPEAERDPGRKDATKADADFGKFKTPTLRSVALSSPYFHDGSAQTLDDAIEYMSEGFTRMKGAKIDEALKPRKLSKKERASIKAFLESLNSEATFPHQKPELPPTP